MESANLQIFDQLLKDGIIDQELYEIIISYVKERAAREQPDTAAPAEGFRPPALPDQAQEGPSGAEEQLLKSLLDSGAITQEQ